MIETLHNDIQNIVSSGHRLSRYFADQLTILNRTEEFIADTAQSRDALDELDHHIAVDDLARMQNVLGEEVELTQRNQKLNATAERINAREYGAVGDECHDDGPALRAAVAALTEKGNCAVLFLPRGDYRIEDLQDAQVRAALLLENLRDVRLEGERGTRLISTEIGGVLALCDCENVRISHIALDLDPSLYTQGVVERLEEHSLEWRLDAGFTTPNEKPFSVKLADGDGLSGSIRNAATGQPLSTHSGIAVTHVEPLGDGRFRLNIRRGEAGRRAKSSQCSCGFSMIARRSKMAA